MLILTSDGLSTPQLIDQFKGSLIPGRQKAAIVPTAANPFLPERHPDIDRHLAIMQQCGLAADCVDIESQDPALLGDYDVIVLIGGNPYHLLDVLQKKNCRPLFETWAGEGKIILGMSAGSMVMGTTIDFVNLLTPEMDPGLADYTALALVDKVVCPHASTFVAGLEGSAQKLAAYQRDTGRTLTYLNDGQALFIPTGE